MADAFDHCEELVRAGDKDRFLATLFAPAASGGRSMRSMPSMSRSRASASCRASRMPGEIRLQWWRDVLAGAQPGGAVRSRRRCVRRSCAIGCRRRLLET